MAGEQHHFPDQSCHSCGRMGCVYFDSRIGSGCYLCVECVKKIGPIINEADVPFVRGSPRGRERDELRRKSREFYIAELNRQLDIFIRFGFPEAHGTTSEKLHEMVRSYVKGFASIDLLPDDFEGIDIFPLAQEVEAKGNLPLVLVISDTRFDFQKQLELGCKGNGVEYNYTNGGVEPRYERQDFFQPVPSFLVYCILNVSPKGEKLHQKLSITEGVAIASAFPQKLREWESLVCSASRYGFVVGTDVLFVATPIKGRNQFCVCYMPERRMQVHGEEATCERRLKFTDLGHTSLWEGIDSSRL